LGGADRALFSPRVAGYRALSVFEWLVWDRSIIGSANDKAVLELLRAVARQRPAAGQGEPDLGLDGPETGGPLEITSSRMESQ
jgi:hypothetical protein